MNYQYPIDYSWETNETVDVIRFFQCVELAYEKGIERDILIAAYQRFKEIVPSKSEEKKLCKDFEEGSGYSTYLLLKKAKETSSEKIKG
ncbi:UPF0223 family protein [Litchfieldia salsa]|uniref:UPF0223 protein SAMN05216565_102238 n=1 Tax=Litchfieldia salsa TaxID=930152 RepID=A0A1H0RIR5_9BACI|nr:Uncharacterized protein YktA, UPF0223 family [Litchfieldia salsa]